MVPQQGILLALGPPRRDFVYKVLFVALTPAWKTDFAAGGSHDSWWCRWGCFCKNWLL